MKVKSDKLKEILASSGLAVGLLGITISTLPKMTVKSENINIPNTIISDELNNNVPINIALLLEEIKSYQDESLDNEQQKTTPGLDGKTIRYHEKIVNPDQSITYMYNNECVKKVSRDTVWFKTVGGSKVFEINNSQYLLPNQATISVVTKRYDDKTKELYRMDGTYTITEIKDNEERIRELRKKDGTIFKYYYNNWISSIEKVKSIPDYHETAFNKTQVIINPDGSLSCIQANETNKDSSEHFILYPDGTSKLFKEYENNDGKKNNTYEIYKGSLLVEKYENSELKEKYENGKRYFFNIYGKSYYEIESSIGITRYTLDDVKYEFVDNEGNTTTYYENGQIETTQKNGITKSYYESGKIKSIKIPDDYVSYYENGQIKYEQKGAQGTGYYEDGSLRKKITQNTEINYYKNGQIESKFEIYDNETKQFKNKYLYSQKGKLIKTIIDGEIRCYNPDGRLVAKGTESEYEVYYPSSEIMMKVSGESCKIYYEKGNKKNEQWGVSTYWFDYYVIYNEEKDEYEIKEPTNAKQRIDYYENSNMQYAEYNEDNSKTTIYYYESGKRKKIYHDIDNHAKDVYEYYENEQLKKYTDMENNYEISYYPDRTIEYEGNPRHDTNINGVYKQVGGESEIANYENGNPRYKKSRQNGKTYEEYYREDGSIKLIQDNDTKTSFDEHQRIKTIETPSDTTEYFYYDEFSLYYIYDKNEGVYNYYYNDEMIYSGKERVINEGSNGYIDKETGEKVITSFIYYLTNDLKIIIKDGVASISEPKQK